MRPAGIKVSIPESHRDIPTVFSFLDPLVTMLLCTDQGKAIRVSQ